MSVVDEQRGHTMNVPNGPVVKETEMGPGCSLMRRIAPHGALSQMTTSRKCMIGRSGAMHATPRGWQFERLCTIGRSAFVL